MLQIEVAGALFDRALTGQLLNMLGSLAMRLLIGGLFIGHGTQKLFGWFGGHGPEGTGQFFESLGLKPGKQQALAAGAAEAGGGALLASGALAPVAGATLTGVMTTAIRTAHAGKGPWTTDGGWEYNAVLIAAVFAIVEERKGMAWALASTAAGAAGALAMQAMTSSGEAEEPEVQETVVKVAEQPVAVETTRVSESPA